MYEEHERKKNNKLIWNCVFHSHCHIGTDPNSNLLSLAGPNFSIHSTI